DTAQGRPEAPLTHELFRAQALSRPAAVAVVQGERRLTYGELEARSNRLAHDLRGRGAGPDVVVEVCAGRTLERVVALYAALKAGGTLLSLDPTYPVDRLQAMLRQSRAAVVLCEGEAAARLGPVEGEILILDGLLADPAGEAGAPPDTPPRTPPDIALDPDHLAFLVYTSGSTGEPKGIAIPHRGLLNMVHWHHRRYGTTAADRGTVTASPAFDPSLLELFCFLSFGASLTILDDET